MVFNCLSLSSSKGSITYLSLKGILKLYYKQKQYLRQAYRQIKSFESINPTGVAAANSAATTSSRVNLTRQSNSINPLEQQQHHINNSYRVESNLRLAAAAIDADETLSSSPSSLSSNYSSSLNNINLDEDIETENNFSD